MKQTQTPNEATAQAHSELAQTLEQLAYKLNYPARFDAAVERGRNRVAALRKNNPGAFYAATGVACLAVGAAAVCAVLRLTKNL